MSEYDEHLAVCNWLSTFYPDIIFFSSGDGLRLPLGLALKFSKLKSNSGIPDIFIAHPNDKYSGLFVELKKTGISIYQKRNPNKFTSETIENQFKTMERLETKNYFCCFAIGFDSAIEVIENYINNKV